MTTYTKHPLDLRVDDVIAVHPDTGQRGRWTVTAPPVRFKDVAEVDTLDPDHFCVRLTISQHDKVTVETTPRQDYIAGLRAYADLLAEHSGIPVGDGNRARLHYARPLVIYTDRPGVEALAAELGRPAAVKTSLGETTYVYLCWHLSGLAIEARLPAVDLCKRVVTSRVRVGLEASEVAEWVLPEPYQPAAQTTEEPAR
jgi:hypothetical protein